MDDPNTTILAAGLALAVALAVAGMALRGRAVRRERLAGANVAGAAVEPYGPPTAAPGPPALPCGGVPVWWYRPFDLLGAAFVVAVFGGLAVAASSMADPTGAVALNAGMLAQSILFQFLMAGIVTAVMLWRVELAAWLGLRWPAWPWVFLIAPCSVLGMWAVFGGLHVAGYVKWMESLGVETVQETVRLLQKSDDPLVLGLMAVAAVLAAPLCEEIVFRGYLYPVLKRYAGLWPAALSSSLVFGLAHGNATAALPLFLFGVLMVVLYERTRSLWAPVAVHFLFNGATVVIQFAARFYEIPLETTP